MGLTRKFKAKSDAAANTAKLIARNMIWLRFCPPHAPREARDTILNVEHGGAVKRSALKCLSWHFGNHNGLTHRRRASEHMLSATSPRSPAVSNEKQRSPTKIRRPALNASRRIEIKAQLRTEPHRPDDDTPARAPIPGTMMVAVPSAIAVVAIAVMTPVAMVPPVPVMPMSTPMTLVFHEFKSALCLAQADDACVGRRC